MTYASRPLVSMATPTEWLAFLRIVVGLYFVKSLITKMSLVMLGGVLPLPARVGALDRHDAEDRDQAGVGEPDPVLQALPREHGADPQRVCSPI